MTQSLGAMMKSEFPPMASPAIGVEGPVVSPIEEKISTETAPKTVLNGIVKLVAGVNPRTELENLSKTRVAIAKELHKVAHNESKFINQFTGSLNAVYLAGSIIGKPLENVVSLARRAEQGVSLVRRFVTGAKINSPFRMLAAFLGVPALVVKDVGKDLYLKNGWQSAFGNAAEDALDAATHPGGKAANDSFALPITAANDDTHSNTNQYLNNGVYRNFLDEPRALISKLKTSIKDLFDPAVEKNESWFNHSQLMSLINITGSALLGLGFAKNNHALARFGRSMQSTGVDATKFTSNNPVRQHSGLGFGFEMLLDAANDKFFKGQSTRLSALVAASGQIGRVLGTVYQDTPFRADSPRIYSKPMAFLKEALPSIKEYANPIALFTRKLEPNNKFEEALGLTVRAVSKPVEAAPIIDSARELAKVMGNIARAKAPRRAAEDVVFEDYGVAKTRRRDLSSDISQLADVNAESSFANTVSSSQLADVNAESSFASTVSSSQLADVNAESSFANTVSSSQLADVNAEAGRSASEEGEIKEASSSIQRFAA